MSYSKVTIWSSYLYVYYNGTEDSGWLSGSLKQLSKRIEIIGKSDYQVYNWVVEQFKLGNKIELDEGYIFKMDMNKFIPGKARGKPWVKPLKSDI